MDVVVRWRSREYRVEGARTLGELKRRVGELTGVDAKRQKLMGLPPKAVKGAADDSPLASLGLKPEHRLTMMGSPDSEHEELALAAETAKAAQAALIDDLDDVIDGVEVGIEHNPVYLAKIAARVSSYKPRMLAGARPGKKCLVLDVDYTLFDHRSPAESARELGRPYLHEFLAAAYAHYDLVVWSATSMSWIVLKMSELGLMDHPSFKLAMLFDAGAMIGVESAQYGLLNVKPLGVLWALFPDIYREANTIMLDDLGRNFLMNPRSGLKIRPCRGMTIAANRAADVELVGLSEYLELIRDDDDLSALDHRSWERTVRKRRAMGCSDGRIGGLGGAEAEGDAADDSGGRGDGSEGVGKAP